ncbi:MAG: hypothetical protein Q8O76_15075, partial [Chloroflexota bacterium]|nr:hypothetical protein [Chloroflexota bacterium]
QPDSNILEQFFIKAKGLARHNHPRYGNPYHVGSDPMGRLLPLIFKGPRGLTAQALPILCGSGLIPLNLREVNLSGWFSGTSSQNNGHAYES